MGCAASCVNRVTMSLFGKHSTDNDDARAKLERKLYLAKESPEPDFDLSDCQIRHVPSGIYSICKVFRKDRLYLHENNLHSLEEGGQISDLYLLKVLNLSSNKFTRLPDDIRYLVNLRELYLQNNLIKVIPDTINFLQCLQILDISNNRLKCLTPALGKLTRLRKLKITDNSDLIELCPELCYATNLTMLELDCEQFIFPPSEITIQGTIEIMKFLCIKMDFEYSPPLPESDTISVQTPNSLLNPFERRNTVTWEEQEAAIIEQENRIHEAAKQQREFFLTKIMHEQFELDTEIAKIHEARDLERQRLIKAIQDNEKEIECLIKNFMESDCLQPEVVQQQLAYEQAEHDRLLEIARQNYDNIKKADILKAMETLLEEDYSIQHSKKHIEDHLYNMKQGIMMQELEGTEKLTELLRAKDQSRTILLEQLLEDQDIQKAIVASLIERVDARSWSLNQEITLIMSHLARLSAIEQEKKKLQVACNYNELLHQRTCLISLLDDLLNQQNKRRLQLIETLKEMENEVNKPSDFWLKNYQKLMDSAPKTLLDISNNLDPLLANYLLQEGVIHCLPFLVKFLFSDESLLDITEDKLRKNGVSLTSDREGIIRAINYYVQAKSKNHNYQAVSLPEPSAPSKQIVEEQNCTGVVSSNETETSVLDSECVICMDAKCEVVFVPCGHMCCCNACSDQEMNDCPMCRATIERRIKVIVA